MKRHIFASIIALTLLAGCATRSSKNLPQGAQLVGGGLSVTWTAPRDGTAILVEATQGKMVRSESLKERDQFNFNPLETDNTLLLNQLFYSGSAGAQTEMLQPLPRNARFLLYFVPVEKP